MDRSLIYNYLYTYTCLNTSRNVSCYDVKITSKQSYSAISFLLSVPMVSKIKNLQFYLTNNKYIQGS